MLPGGAFHPKHGPHYSPELDYLGSHDHADIRKQFEALKILQEELAKVDQIKGKGSA